MLELELSLQVYLIFRLNIYYILLTLEVLFIYLFILQTAEYTPNSIQTHNIKQ